jgi:hypothetical protein
MTVKHRYDSNDERFKSPENTFPLDQQLLEEQPLYKTTINNEHSSRSHTVFIFKTTTGNTLYFYDLAGSEDTFEMITSSIKKLKELKGEPLLMMKPFLLMILYKTNFSFIKTTIQKLLLSLF